MKLKSAAAPLTLSLAIFMFVSKLARLFIDYPYPVLERFRLEYFVWDVFELVVWVPALIAAAFLIQRKKTLGNLIALGISSVLIFQWSAVMFGMVNFWSPVIVLYVALAGAAMISNWRDLPVLAPMPLAPFSFFLNSGILTLVLVAISAYMGLEVYGRLAGGAPGLNPELLTTQAYLDYADASLNEPIIFFVAVMPLMLVGIYNLPKRNKLGYRTSLAANVFSIGFIIAKIMTGPGRQLIEYSSVELVSIVKTVVGLLLIALLVAMTRKLAVDHELIYDVKSDDYHVDLDDFRVE
ncbi:MAG: hypothetical protein GY771_14555 [bacterium]|nr:hypothetical protein [bacterium]